MAAILADALLPLAILVHDRADDEAVGDEPRKEVERRGLVGAGEFVEEHAVPPFDPEGEREEQEEAVVRRAPEAQEEEACHETRHRDRPDQHLVHQSFSHASPNTIRRNPTRAAASRGVYRSTSGRTKRSMTRSTLLVVRPTKQRVLQKSRRARDWR